jgi:hypothetical protein
LKGLCKGLKRLPKRIVADAAWGSEENYAYLEQHGAGAVWMFFLDSPIFFMDNCQTHMELKALGDQPVFGLFKIVEEYGVVGPGNTLFIRGISLLRFRRDWWRRRNQRQTGGWARGQPGPLPQQSGRWRS